MAKKPMMLALVAKKKKGLLPSAPACQPRRSCCLRSPGQFERNIEGDLSLVPRGSEAASPALDRGGDAEEEASASSIDGVVFFVVVVQALTAVFSLFSGV